MADVLQKCRTLSPALKKKKKETLKSVFSFTLRGLPGTQLLRHLCGCLQAGRGKPHAQPPARESAACLLASQHIQAETLDYHCNKPQTIPTSTRAVMFLNLKITVPSQLCSTLNCERVLLCPEWQMLSLQWLTKMWRVSRLSNWLWPETGIFQAIWAFRGTIKKTFTETGVQLCFGMHSISISKILSDQRNPSIF